MYSILDFGASPERPLNTEPIQKALDACSAAGGGTVVIPSGTYRCGSLFLRSHVELHLESGAVLQASSDPDDYNGLDAYPANAESQSEGWSGKHLIIAWRVEDASLTGPGAVFGCRDDFYGPSRGPGGGAAWRDGYCGNKSPSVLRPGQLIVFCESRNVRVLNLQIYNATCWTLFFHGCEDVQARGLLIRNGIMDGNTDGIDIDCSRNVTVSDCNIDTGDDAIALRGSVKRLTSPRVCENITISNCVLASSSSCFRIGVGTGTIRHVEIGNCVIHRAGRAMNFQSSYSRHDAAGVDISHIHVHHLDVRGASCGISMTPGSEEAVGRIHGISFDSCRFESCLPCCWIRNSGDVRISGVRFRDCDFSVVSMPYTFVDYEIGTAALMAVHSDDIAFRGCRLFWNTDAPYWTRGFFAEDVPGLVVDDCSFPDFPGRQN